MFNRFSTNATAPRFPNIIKCLMKIKIVMTIVKLLHKWINIWFQLVLCPRWSLHIRHRFSNHFPIFHCNCNKHIYMNKCDNSIRPTNNIHHNLLWLRHTMVIKLFGIYPGSRMFYPSVSPRYCPIAIDHIVPLNLKLFQWCNGCFHGLALFQHASRFSSFSTWNKYLFPYGSCVHS